MALAAAAFIAAASAGSVSPSAVYATPQRLVAVGGARRLNLYCTGSGNPTVLLDAGSGNWMTTWRHVQEEIGATTRVCAYDRAASGLATPPVARPTFTTSSTTCTSSSRPRP